jgi:hypothetical protein
MTKLQMRVKLFEHFSLKVLFTRRHLERLTANRAFAFMKGSGGRFQNLQIRLRHTKIMLQGTFPVTRFDQEFQSRKCARVFIHLNGDVCDSKPCSQRWRPLRRVASRTSFSSGVAFVLMYRIGRRFPSRLAAVVYSPLEALAKRSMFFQSFYTGFQWWMYRRLVNDSPPPPPLRIPLM